MIMQKFPIPKNYRDTLDRFAVIYGDAPEFKHVRVKYAFTLDDVMDSLRSGVTGVAGRIKNPEALALIQKCLEEIDMMHQFYRENKIPEAKRRLLVAEDFFKQAAKLRSSKQSEALVEDDGQP